MIEYDGYISGQAKKRFKKMEKQQFLLTISFAFLLVMPLVVTIARSISLFSIVGGYWVLMIITLGIVLFSSNRQLQKTLPKKITITSDFIVSIADQDTISRSVHEVKTILDYSEYYVMIFPMGRKTNRFICQKNLLSNGTEKEFKELFKDKIKRMD